MGAYDDLVPQAGQTSAGAFPRVSGEEQLKRDRSMLRVKLDELKDDPSNEALRRDIAFSMKALGGAGPSPEFPPEDPRTQALTQAAGLQSAPAPSGGVGSPYADLIPSETPASPAPVGASGFQDQLSAAKRAMGLSGRSLIEGAMAPSSTILGGLYGIYNVGADLAQGEGKGFRFKDPAQRLSQTLTQAGLPNPQSELERVADFGMQTLAGGAALPIPAAKSPIAQARLTVKDASTKKIQDAGYVVPPSLSSGGNIGTDILESIGGKSATKQQATLQNQAITDALARKAAGLSPEEEITRAALKAARDDISEPYRLVSELSKRASLALDRLKQSRHDAQLYWKSYNRTANPEHLAKAKRLDAGSEMLESFIEKEAASAGTPELVDSLKAARVALAKNFDVERALNTETGEVSAKVIGRMADKKRFTGELGTIASFAKVFPQVAGEGAKTMAPGVSHSDALAAAALGIGGSAAGVGPLAAGLPLMRGPARAAALSNWLRQTAGGPTTPEQSALRARIAAALAMRGNDGADDGSP